MARAGKLAIFTGISDPYEEPTDAELAIDTTALDIEDATEHLRQALAETGLLVVAPPGPHDQVPPQEI